MIGAPEPWVALLAGLIACVGVAALIALACRPLLKDLRRWSPEVRASACLMLLLAPCLVGIAAAAMSGLSADGVVVDLVTHHCHANMASCSAHEPLEPNAVLSLLGGALLLGILLWLGASCVSQLRMTMRSTNLLRIASRNRARADVGILGTDDTVACAIGLFRPRVFLSRGLWRRLSIGERKVVLRHERAHVARHDYSTRALAALCAMVHGRATGTRLLDELVLAQEQACDRAAARYYGTLRTAETLLKVERIQRRRNVSEASSPGILDGSVTARVNALLEPAFLPVSPCLARLYGAVTVTLVGLVAGIEPLHHAAESIVQSIAW